MVFSTQQTTGDDRGEPDEYWSAVNAPVSGPDGRVVLIASVMEDVNDRMRRFMSVLAADAEHEDPE